MELLLRKEVPSLGKAGAVVNVTAGYARNYLLPQKLAVAVTPDNVRMIEREQARVNQQVEAEKQKLLEMARKIESLSPTVTAKANEEGTLFGSIPVETVAATIETEGAKLPEGVVITLTEEGRTFPLKELGVYHLKVALGHGVEASTKFWIVQE